jgi:hypothetical protein
VPGRPGGQLGGGMAALVVRKSGRGGGNPKGGGLLGGPKRALWDWAGVAYVVCIPTSTGLTLQAPSAGVVGGGGSAFDSWIEGVNAGGAAGGGVGGGDVLGSDLVAGGAEGADVAGFWVQLRTICSRRSFVRLHSAAIA